MSSVSWADSPRPDRPWSIGGLLVAQPGPVEPVDVTERLLEELSFEAPDMKMGKVIVNAAYVDERLEEITQDEDLSKFIL